MPTGGLPKPPKSKPPTSAERTEWLKRIARAAAETGLAVEGLIKGSEWLAERKAEIEAYNDDPRPLADLQRGALSPRPGYDIHHIVERNQLSHFPKEAIEGLDNLVRIPRLKHQEINAWYQTKNPEYGGESPREYLNGRNWLVQRAVGLDALRRAGVLKP